MNKIVLHKTKNGMSSQTMYVLLNS